MQEHLPFLLRINYKNILHSVNNEFEKVLKAWSVMPVDTPQSRETWLNECSAVALVDFI